MPHKPNPTTDRPPLPAPTSETIRGLEIAILSMRFAYEALVEKLAELKGEHMPPWPNAGGPNDRRPITPDEAARRLGIDQTVKHPARTVQGMARRGELRSYVIAGKVMIDPVSVEEMLGGVALDDTAPGKEESH